MGLIGRSGGPRRGLGRRAGAWLALLVMTAPATPARADERPPRLVGLHRRDGWLACSVGLQDLFWPTDSERLRSGFVSRVVIRAELYKDGDRRPIAIADRGSRILYDLWDERFRVQVVDRDGLREHTAATVAGGHPARHRPSPLRHRRARPAHAGGHLPAALPSGSEPAVGGPGEGGAALAGACAGPGTGRGE